MSANQFYYKIERGLIAQKAHEKVRSLSKTLDLLFPKTYFLIYKDYHSYLIYNQSLLQMGNQLLKGYTLQGDPISQMGFQKMWRIYQGMKNNTNTNATIFAIQKKALPKSERDDLIQYAKRQAMSLARIRHPGVLAISQALIEDEQVMAFSTQQVIGNLTLLSKDGRLKQIISNEIELRLNLFPLLDTIQFLHENVKTVHLSINFDNIYITKQGKWKLSGFSNSQVYGGEGLEEIKHFRCGNYSYCSPEVATQKKFQKRSDVYSLGILILDLYLVISGKYQVKVYKNEAEYSQNYQTDLLKKINNEALEKIEAYKQLKSLLKTIIARDPSKRGSLHQLSTSKWLNDKLVLTVKYLENITNYDNKQQIQFLKGLLGVLNHFQPRILLRKILPLLLDLLKFKHLIPSVVYICLEIMKNGNIISQSDFREKIWPSFKKVVTGKEMTAHSLFLFVENMQKIEKVVGLQEMVQCIIPLYVKCFDCPTKLKQLALFKTDYILSKMDYQFVKTKLIPKIMGCIKDQSPEVHKKSLIALKKTIKILDTQTITSIVLPGLQNCKKSVSDPFVNAITVSIYTMLGKTLPSQILCSKLIPTILPYLSDPNVGPNDFFSYKNAMMTMLQKIESERKKFWDDSQITQSPAYTEKDFEFEDQSKKNPPPEAAIGKGDYNFLSNYNNNKNENTEQNQVKVQTNQTEVQRKQPDFNFNSPWGFEAQTNQNVNSFQAQSQPQPQINPIMEPRQQIKTNLTLTTSQSYTGTHIGSQNKSVQQSLNMGGFNQMINKNQLTNQPISPESRQNFPKLKGPSIKKAEQQMKSDPWASISINNPTPPVSVSYNEPIKNSWKYPETEKNYGSSIGYNSGVFSQTPVNTNYPNPSFGYNNPYNMSSLDDPFAQIQKSTSPINTSNLFPSSSKVPKNDQFGFGDNYLNLSSNQNYNLGNPSLSTFGSEQFQIGQSSGLYSLDANKNQSKKNTNFGDEFDLI